MDELTRLLKDDAQRIDATVSPELERSIEGALELIRAAPPTAKARRSEWWAALLGLTTAAATGALLAGIAPFLATPSPDNQSANRVRPAQLAQRATADLVSPLEQELARLASDLGSMSSAFGIEWRVRRRH